ncbi:MAG: TlpA disulfide reductase family protein [Bacteroidota bacterium]|nr:TlpA disulfide reductase family protein [Bacteroidota bacterium]
MKHFLIIFLALFVHITIYSQNVSVIKITDLEKRIRTNSDTIYIVNFWATWCVPCVKELPDFDSINTAYINKKVKVLLVSLDFKEDLKIKLLPFISTKKIRSEVVLLDELNANYFIPKISDEWSGAIPATLIINNQRKLNRFFEKRLNYEFLKTEIENSLINH